jgi:hypothetical protein
MNSQLKDGRPQQPSNVPGSTNWEFDGAETFADAVRQASDAVTTLADRLNALALRIALLGAAAGAENDLESCLVRLYSLVDSAGSQIRLIQNLLPVLQAGAQSRESRADRDTKESN